MFPFFKDRPIGALLWRRFHTAPEGFTVLHEQPDLWSWHAVTKAERAVDSFTRLLGEMPAVVSLEISDAHAGRSWKGGGCDSAGVRGAIAPLREMLIEHAGVEITVFAADDQITLNPVLELFLYSKTDHWTQVLLGIGLPEERMVRTRSWKLRREGLTPAPALSDAVARAAESLRLEAQ